MECEEEVAKLPPPPLAHENPEAFLVQRPQACVIETSALQFSETYGLPFCDVRFLEAEPP